MRNKKRPLLTPGKTQKDPPLSDISHLHMREGGREMGRGKGVPLKKNNMVGNKTLESSESVLRWHLSRNLDGTSYSQAQAHTKLPDLESKKNFLPARLATKTELFACVCKVGDD